jgi:hypothetical protein
MALNPCVVPSGIAIDDGDTVIETSAAAVTVSDVVPLAVPTVALMPAAPTPTLCERPVESIVATDGVSDDQTAVPVRSMTVESEYVPVAVNCWLAPF